MTGDGTERQVSTTPGSAELIDPLREAKLRIPSTRTEWIVRPRLLNVIAAAVRSAVVLVAAPAGYGKTTVITQWAASDRAGTVAWLTLTPADNEPIRLWMDLTAALERAGCAVNINDMGSIPPSSPTILATVVPRVAEALAAHPQPLTVVLDDCHVLRAANCSDQLDRLVELLPAHTHLVLISRSDPILRLGRLRVQGRLTDIRAHDLAFDADEVEAVLLAAGVALSKPELSELVRHTEGWPAAVYLAALSLIGSDDAESFIRNLSSNSRFIADYLSEEVLDRQDPELRAFIMTMAVFDGFTVALADHVIPGRAAPRLLHRLERTNLFLIPLRDGWFRFHPLFASYAASALELEDPDHVAELHRRGAEWFAAHDHTDEAVRHLLAASDSQQAAALIQGNWLGYVESGRTTTILGWLHGLRGTPADTEASATVTAAWIAALTGDRAELRRRLEALESMTEDGPLPDGTKSPRSASMLIRGLFGFDGPDRMLADARRAAELENTPGTSWHAVACTALGHAALVTGDVALARAQLGEAARTPTAPAIVRLVALGTLALCEAEQGNYPLSERLAAQATDIVTEHHLHAQPQAIFAITAHGAALAAAGHLAEATTVLDDGLRERRHHPGLSPWPLVHHLLVAAAVAHHAGDPSHADQLLTELDDLIPWDDETIEPTRSRMAATRRSLTKSDPPPEGDAHLTPREQQVLRRLHGSQTLREIGRDLYLSHNTIKTITASVYRKLGAHSRTQAVEISRTRSAAAPSRVVERET